MKQLAVIIFALCVFGVTIFTLKALVDFALVTRGKPITRVTKPRQQSHKTLTRQETDAIISMYRVKRNENTVRYTGTHEIYIMTR